MPIYEHPVRVLLQDFAKERLVPGREFTKDEAVKWMQEKFPKIKPITSRMHVDGMSTNSLQRRHHPHIRPGLGWDVFYKLPNGKYRLYEEGGDPIPLYKSTIAVNNDGIAAAAGDDAYGDDESLNQDGSGTFAYEHHLRDYLARNLSSIEPGLRLYEEEGFGGVEFPVGGRFIDVLAIDAQGNYVVVELKVSRGYERTIGQLLRYMGWIQKNLAGKKNVRGVIVANEITEDLKLAASRIEGIKLLEYEISFALKAVS